jgi:hypothetical protein
MMESVNVDLYAVDGNVAVVRLEARRFPGVLVQGDTMKMLSGILDEALQAANPNDGRAALVEAQDMISGFLRIYERALSSAGERPPYSG